MWFLCAIKYFLKPHVRSQARWADRGLRREVWTVWGSESIRSRFLVRGRSLRSRNPRNAGFRWNGPAGELAWESAGCGSRAFGGSTCGALIGMGEQHGKRTERDAHGRRILVPFPDEQVGVDRIKSLRGKGLSFAKIARQLNAEQTPARRNGTWRTSRSCIILNREGMHMIRKNRPHIPTRFDPEPDKLPQTHCMGDAS